MGYFQAKVYVKFMKEYFESKQTLKEALAKQGDQMYRQLLAVNEEAMIRQLDNVSM